MASHTPDFGSASALPLAAVLGSIPSYPRPVLERLVYRLIEHLDEQDGDTDVELNGDELDGSTAEDDWHHASRPAGLSYVSASNCEDAEDDDPGEMDDAGSCCSYGNDQREIAVHGGTWRAQ